MRRVTIFIFFAALMMPGFFMPVIAQPQQATPEDLEKLQKHLKKKKNTQRIDGRPEPQPDPKDPLGCRHKRPPCPNYCRTMKLKKPPITICNVL